MITNSVFVIDENGTPLQPTNPGKARILQREGKAKKIRLYPFTIILQHKVSLPVSSDLELRIHPGSKFTGFSIVSLKTETTIWGMELEHRGQRLREDLQKRAGFRRGRRSRNLRYRKKRFNRHKPDGWLAPSLRHRLLTVETWIRRIKKYAPIVSIAVKLGLDNLKIVTYIKPKEEYKHCRAGDYVKTTLLFDTKSRKKDDLGEQIVNVKAGTYQCRIKTPTKTGAEVVINGKRVSVKQNCVKFIHRSDGYSYNFTQINPVLLQYQAI